MTYDETVWRDRAIDAANKLLLKEEQLKVAISALVIIKSNNKMPQVNVEIACKALTDIKQIREELNQVFGKDKLE